MLKKNDGDLPILLPFINSKMLPVQDASRLVPLNGKKSLPETPVLITQNVFSSLNPLEKLILPRSCQEVLYIGALLIKQ